MLFLLSAVALIYPAYEFVTTDVFQRNLVQETVTSSSILSNFGNVSSSPNPHYSAPKTEVLGFLTPWNDVGYNLSLAFGSKFTILVPVWLQAVRRNGSYVIAGDQDVHTDWLSTMRLRHPKLRIVPRLIFEIDTSDFARDFQTIVASLKAGLSTLEKRHHFDGIFLEFPSYFASLDSLPLLPRLVTELRKALPRRARLLADIPSDEKFHYGRPGSDLVGRVIRELDWALITVYEVPNVESLSPAASLARLHKWTEEMRMTAKVIVGLPFFGIDFRSTGQGYMFAEEITNTLRNQDVKITWIEAFREHGFFYSDADEQHAVYYPTLRFLKDRFDAARQKQFAGFGIWEIAQGMPYFFDLL
jgi:chitinase domain-containing protein 1